MVDKLDLFMNFGSEKRLYLKRCVLGDYLRL